MSPSRGCEIFFRILKSGCQVEVLQLAARERLERALALHLVIAWRILHRVTLGRGCPGPPSEGRRRTRRPPRPQGPLGESLLKLMAYVEAFQAAREVYGEG